ncbi:MAG: hypothetical protein GY731_10895, partial [Gammaproteobacteria bacterium]|nr:hypothetical protein [Gammaproteobacteria bacterium]
DEVRENRDLVHEIGTRLRTLLLQVAQLDQGLVDRIQSSEYAEETTKTVETLQSVVNARRRVATEYLSGSERLMM